MIAYVATLTDGTDNIRCQLMSKDRLAREDAYADDATGGNFRWLGRSIEISPEEYRALIAEEA